MIDIGAHIEQCYATLLQVQSMLESAGQADVAAFLHHPIGLLEDRFDLASAEALAMTRPLASGED